MAAQPLSLEYYGEAETAISRRPSRPHARSQQSLEQPSAAMSMARTTIGPLPRLAAPQSISEAMTQLGANALTSFVRNSSMVVAEIDGLIAGHEDEIKPSEYAYSAARSLVESAYGQIKLRESVPEIVPEASVTTDDVGGIRLAWRLGPKQVRANFGANAQLRSYIYFESDIQHAVEQLDVQHLAGRLAWLTEK